MALVREFGKDFITANTIAVGGIKTTRAANQHANEELVRLATERLAVTNLANARISQRLVSNSLGTAAVS